MSTPELPALVTQLTAADPATADRGTLANLVGCSQQVRSWLDAFDARVARRADELAAAGTCEPAATLLAGGGRRTAREAAAVVRRGEVGGLLPGFETAMADGVVTAGHADALARAAQSLPESGRAKLVELEDAVVASAARSSVEDFARQIGKLADSLAGDDGVSRDERRRRARFLRRWVDDQGMCHTHLAVDPDTDERVAKALRGALLAEPVDDRTSEQVQADALVALITGARADSGDRRSPEVAVLVDYDTLVTGLQERSVGETESGQPLAPETVRRLACDAEIIPIVLDGHGVVLDVGRSQRTATLAQRWALRAMHRSCVFPNCRVAFEHCDIHHVTPWQLGGATDLANLVPACSRHHHLAHEGGWTLTLHPDRTVEWHMPDGTIHHTGNSVDVAPDGVAAWRAEIADLAEQAIAHAWELAARNRNRNSPREPATTDTADTTETTVPAAHDPPAA